MNLPTIDKRVMVLGDGETAVRLSKALNTSGLDSYLLWAGGTPLEGIPEGIAVILSARLVALQGQVGDFTATILSSDQFIRKLAGSVMVAFESRTEPVFDVATAPMHEGVATLEDAEAILRGERQISGDVKTVVFLDRLDGASTPASSERQFNAILSFLDRGIKCYAIGCQMKVASRNLELLYGRARDGGCVFFKNDFLSISFTQGRPLIRFEDLILHEEKEICADMVILAENFMPGASLPELREILGVETDKAGFMQADNVLRLPLQTNRRGVFVVGPSRAPVTRWDLDQEIPAAVSQVKELFAWAESFPYEEVISFDIDACARCLTCFRSCPHGAIHFTNRPNFLALACQQCGICTAFCPNEAIELRDMEKDRIKGLIANERKGSDSAPVVVFACEKSGARILNSIPSEDTLLRRIRWIQLPCGGTLRTQYLLDAIGNASEIPERVMVLACHEDNCRSGMGTIKARATVERVKSFLDSVGWNQTKIEFISTASNEAERIRKLLAAS